MSIAENKVFYNRVRRACIKHGIEIKFTGTHRNYQAMPFKSSTDGQRGWTR